MLRKLLIAGALVAGMLTPGAVLAHEGHAHKVMGTVSSVNGNDLLVKTTDGKTVTVTLSGKTKITRGKETLAASALKAGDRVVAEGAESKGVVTATTLQVGVAEKSPSAAAAKPAASHAH